MRAWCAWRAAEGWRGRRYARSKIDDMDEHVSGEQQRLREQRKSKREPHVNFLGIPLRYDEPPPAYLQHAWDGLKAPS